LSGPGFPIFGFGRETECAGADTGSFSFGSAREREKIPLADRCFP
jgi:hypothetical protein